MGTLSLDQIQKLKSYANVTIKLNLKRNEVLENFSNSKIWISTSFAECHYYCTCSEAISSGCVPLVWKYTINHEYIFPNLVYYYDGFLIKNQLKSIKTKLDYFLNKNTDLIQIKKKIWINGRNLFNKDFINLRKYFDRLFLK